MDAVRFIKERRRMYKVTGKRSPTLAEWIPAEDVVKEVEEWSTAHPHKTRQTVFLEQYPNARVNINTGVLSVYPCAIENGMENTIYCNSISCADCRRKFWMEEIE